MPVFRISLMQQRSATTLFVSSSTTLDSVTAAIGDPEEDRRRRLGTFFVLVKVDEIATLLPWLRPFAQYLEQSFYQALESEPEISVDRALGIVRQRAKLKLQQVTAETRTITVDAVHYCFGTLKGKTLSLTHVGDVHAYLLHRRTANPQDRVQWVDITGTPMRRTPGQQSAAATVVSGAMGDFDTLVVLTESIVETIGLSKLERVLTSASLEGAKTLLERDLKNASNRLSFGALFLRRPLLPAEARGREAVTSSMTTLLARESGTAELLTPQSPSPLKRLIQAGRSVGRPRTNAPEARHTPPPRVDDRRLGRTLGTTTRTIASAIGYGTIQLLLSPIRLITALLSPGERKEFFSRFMSWPESSSEKMIERVRRLDHSSQRLLIVAFLFAFLFMQSLVFLANRQTREVAAGEEDLIVTTIQKALDQAESQLIFHNDIEAARLLSEAAMSLAQFQPRSRTGEERQRILSGRLDSIRARLMHLVVVPEPDRFVEFTDDQLRSATAMIRSTQGYVIIDGNRKTFGVVSLDGKTEVKTVDTQALAAVTYATLNEQNQPSLLTETPALASFDVTAGNIRTIPIEGAASGASSIAFYRSRLYLLDAKGKQIWRHQSANGQFARGVPWAKGNADILADATDLVIDGDVYVLLKSGSIRKFFDGVEQSWVAATPIEPASSASRLIAPPNVRRLFAMDSASKRIFVWNKDTGELDHQFSFPNLNRLIDFSIDEKGTTATLLSSDGLYRFNIDTSAPQ